MISQPHKTNKIKYVEARDTNTEKAFKKKLCIDPHENLISIKVNTIAYIST
jgi:hypothetical protein